jgi:hypothetical protein
MPATVWMKETEVTQAIKVAPATSNQG